MIEGKERKWVEVQRRREENKWRIVQRRLRKRKEGESGLRMIKRIRDEWMNEERRSM